jgi:DNA-binding transcriptional MerR regulator
MTANLASSLKSKSPEAFRTISEAAAEIDVPQHVLRFWESRFNQIRPLKRAGGRRFYRPEDVELLRGIRTLLYHEGYTIKGVQKVLRERGIRHVAEIGRLDGLSCNDAFVSDSILSCDSPVEAFEVLARVHDETASMIDASHRERLEELLGELLALKARLRAVKRAA